MMEYLYVAGGRRKKDSFQKKEWNWFQSGLIIRIDLVRQTAETCVEYISPPEACAYDEDPSILFKAGAVQEGKLYACTQTEVLVYELPDFKQVGYISLPFFNDVHHVATSINGSFLIANTGLDMVVEITQEGKKLREWSVLGGDPWETFSKDIDYRRVITTKPHKAHPNFVFQIGQEIWATRFEQRDAVCLTQEEQRIEIGIERPHDGIVFNDFIYFTTVDGHIVVANADNKKTERVVDLNAITPRNNIALGWCRGLKVIDESSVIVGFSRLRSTMWRENVRWIKRQLGKHAGTLPTRVALYDLQRQKLCWEYNLERQGMDAVFSIHIA